MIDVLLEFYVFQVKCCTCWGKARIFWRSCRKWREARKSRSRISQRISKLWMCWLKTKHQNWNGLFAWIDLSIILHSRKRNDIFLFDFSDVASWCRPQVRSTLARLLWVSSRIRVDQLHNKCETFSFLSSFHHAAILLRIPRSRVRVVCI